MAKKSLPQGSRGKTPLPPLGGGSYAPPHHMPTRDELRSRRQFEDSMDDVERGPHAAPSHLNPYPPVERKHAPETVPPPSTSTAPIDFGGQAPPQHDSSLIKAPVLRADPEERHYVARPGGAPPHADDVYAPYPLEPIQANRTYILAQISALIIAFDEADNYDPLRRHNRAPPPLWVDDAKYLADVRALLKELRRLNKQMERLPLLAQVAPPQTVKTVGVLSSSGRKFAESYADTLGKGTAYLTIGSLGALLLYLGADKGIVDAIFALIKAPK